MSYSASVQHQAVIDESMIDSRLIIAGQERIRRHAELLRVHLPLQIAALQEAQRPFQSIIDAQITQNPLEALKAAATAAEIQWIIGQITDVLKCLNSPDSAVISIGVGASPALKQNTDLYIGYLDAAKTDCAKLKALAPAFQEITWDTPNPELPTYE